MRELAVEVPNKKIVSRKGEESPRHEIVVKEIQSQSLIRLVAVICLQLNQI